MTTPIKVEIWSDIVCPWCYIGKRRFESALEGFDGEVEIQWRSFELDPGAPKEPQKDLVEALAEKYRMSKDRAEQMIVQMKQTGAEEGLKLNFSIARGGNTLDAHRLLHIADQEGKQSQMKERLLLAYMTEGEPISDRDTLARLAGEVELDVEKVRAILETDRYIKEVRADEARAHEIGVRGVPFFLIDGKRGISGAQTPDLLLGQLEEVRSELEGGEVEPGQGCEIPR